MTNVFVQFSDVTQTKIVSVFACPQNNDDYPNQAEIEDSDGRYIAFINPLSTKNGVWELIRLERDRRQLDGGVKVGQHWFLSSERATSEYNTIINTTRGIPDSTIIRAGWRTMDGALVDMTPALALQILKAGIAQRCAIDDAAQVHRAAMEARADPASYDLSGDWPETFGG